MSGLLIRSLFRAFFRTLPRSLAEWAIPPVVVAYALCFAVFAPLASAQDVPGKAHVDEVLKGLNRSHGLGPVAISPDGTLLAYVRRAKDGSELVVAPFSDAAKATRITAAKKSDTQCGDTDPAW